MNAPFSHIAVESIGHQLRAARRAAGLSRPTLAKTAGLRFETIAKFENSGAGQVATLTVLLDALRCRIADQPVEVPVGEWLRSLREARGLGLRDAAKLAHLTPPTVIALERSRGQMLSLSKLLQAYSIPLRLSASDGQAKAPLLGRRIAASDQIEFYEGDAREWVTKFVAERRLFDCIVTDPPYDANTLGAAWDRSGVAMDVAFWRLCAEVLKPGAFLLAFVSPRRSHRVAAAVEDAGFELRDPIAWLFSSGTPWGSKDVSKAIDRHLVAEREIIGTQPRAGKPSSGGSARQGLPGRHNSILFTGRVLGGAIKEEASEWSGWATRLKPGREDILVARKPLGEATAEANVLQWGTGAFNIDAPRVPSARPPRSKQREGFRQSVSYQEQDGFYWKPSPLGRYPSDVVLGEGFDREVWSNHFHVAKPVGRDRWGHPTAKPVELLRKLVRLATPPGGVVLDCFAGCASVGEAAVMDGFRYVGIELSPVYAEASRRRLGEAQKPRPAKHQPRTVPFGWYGGKATQLRWLLPLLPKCVHYCEPFGGAGSVLLNREPAPIETLNDLYGEVAHFFRTLRDRPDELIDAISLTPFSRDEHADALEVNPDLDALERARLFFVRARQTRYGIVHRATTGSWATARESTRRGMSATVAKWLGSIDGLHEVATRLRRVQIENRPALELIRAYDDRKTLFYLDPPYLAGTRRDKDAYGAFEMTDEDHRELADALNSCRGKVAVSGYAHALYDELFPRPRWRKIVAEPKRLSISRSVGTRSEVLWVNYRP